MRKLICGFCDQVRLNQACSATQTRYDVDILPDRYTFIIPYSSIDSSLAPYSAHARPPSGMISSYLFKIFFRMRSPFFPLKLDYCFIFRIRSSIQL